jgi:hypothetical protein
MSGLIDSAGSKSGVIGAGVPLTPQFMVKMTNSQEHAHDCSCLVNFDTVVYETNAGSWVTASDRWIPAAVGKYVIGIGLHWMNGNNNIQQGIVYLKLNGSTTVSAVDTNHYPDNLGRRHYLECVQIVDVTATSDFFEAYSQQYNASDSSGPWTVSGSSTVSSHMWGYRIGPTD